RDLDTVFATMAQSRAGALGVGSDPFFLSRRDLIAELATRHAMPTIFYLREFAAAGGLMSYGVSVTDGYRQVGIYAAGFSKASNRATCPSRSPPNSGW